MRQQLAKIFLHALFLLLFMSLYVVSELNVEQLKITIEPFQAHLGATVIFSCEVDCGKECIADCGRKMKLMRLGDERSLKVEPKLRTRWIEANKCIANVDFKLTNVNFTDGGFYKCQNSNESHSQLALLTVFGSLSVISARVSTVQRAMTLLVNDQQKTFNLTAIEPNQRLHINCSLDVSSSNLPHLITDPTILYGDEDRVTSTANVSSMDNSNKKESKATFKWRLEGQLHALDNGLPKYVIKHEWLSGHRLHSSLTFPSVQRDDVGTYICTAISSARNILSEGVVNMFSVPLAAIKTVYYTNGSISSFDSVSDSSTIRPTAGTNLSLLCDVTANPPAMVWWQWGDENLRSDLNMREGAELHLGHLKFTQRAFYYCNANNSDGEAEAGVKLLVRDPLAALWPTIGIFIEIIFIVGITIFFEIRRSFVSVSHKSCVRHAKDSDFPLTAL